MKRQTRKQGAMPRQVEKLVLNRGDARVLEAISSGATPAGEDVRRRVDVLLDQAAGLSVRATAAKRHVRINTVTDIRRRWEERGLASLEDAPRSGRPRKGATPEEVEAAVDEFLASWRQEHDGAGPIVAEVAEELGCGVVLARDALKKRGLVRTRAQAWSFVTDDGPHAHVAELVGIYLSHTQQVIAVLVGDSDMVWECGSGDITTHSAILARKLERLTDEDGHIGLADALEIVSSAKTAGGRQRDEGALPFVRRLLPAEGIGTLRLLTCGDSIIGDGRTVLIGAQVEEAVDLHEWEASVSSLLRVLYADDASLAERVASGIVSFVSNAEPGAEPFRWSKTVRAVSPQDSPDNQAADVLAPGTIEVTVRVMGDDGEWVNVTARASSGVTPTNFGLTPQAYAASVGKVEQALLAASNVAQHSALEACLVSVATEKR